MSASPPRATSRPDRRSAVGLLVAAALVALVAARGVASAQDAPAPGTGPAAPGGAPAGAPPAPPPAPAPVPTPEQAGDAVLAAVVAKDGEALRALAAKDAPDPWLVADELVRRGQHDAAEMFAKAAPRPDTDALPAYVASRRGKPDDPARRERLAAANAALGAGKWAEALAAGEPADDAIGEDVVGIRLVMGRGFALSTLHRPAEALPRLRAAGEGAERRGWLARAFRAYGEAGLAAYRGAAYEEASDLFRRQLAVSERRSDRRGMAIALTDIGMVQGTKGDHAEALETDQRALEAWQALGDEHFASMVLNNMGTVLHAMGEYRRAVSVYERALAAKVATGDRGGAAQTLGNIGNSYLALGEHAKALDAQTRALAAKQALGDQGEVARTLGNIGNVRQAMGDYAGALSCHERALDIQEALGDRAQAAKSLSNIGVTRYALGDFDRAIAAQQRAIEIQTRIGDREGCAKSLNNLGNAYEAFGDHEKALASLERALALEEALRNGPGVARVLGNIGIVQSALGRHEEALATQQRALAASEALGDAVGVAVTLGNVGAAYYALGDATRALDAHHRSLTAKESLGDRAGAALTRGNIGSILLARGQPEAAIPHAREAALAVADLSHGFGADEGVALREPMALVYDVGIRAALALRSPEDLAFFLESGRAGALLEGLKAKETLWTTAVPEDLRQAEARARASEAAAVDALRRAVARGGARGAEAVARRADLQEARVGVERVIARMQREAKAGAALVYPRVAPLDILRATLADGDVMVLYGLSETEACALVVTKAGARVVPLGPTIAIADAAAALELEDAQGDPGPSLAALAERVVAPLGLPARAGRILVSPVGVLSLVPFAALMPERAVAYVPSGTTYALLVEQSDAGGSGVLALGDPAYRSARAGDPPDPRAGSATPLTPLPQTRAEAEAVGTVTLLGAQATERGFAEALTRRARWRAVHLACHGHADADYPMRSWLALTPTADDDGFLSCLDVFRMQVPADLVVLSACETGRGKVVNGEGIVGLTRAFMFAGAPRVLCSLWTVDDAATSALMRRFYELWNPKTGSKGLGPADALRQAQEFVRSHGKWKHPYYWAAWVLWGLPD